MAGSEVINGVRTVIEWASLGIEILGATVIVAGVLRVVISRGTIRHLFQLEKPGEYESYKHQMGRSLLLGLEFFVAGDIVRTVALEPTLTNVGVLGLLVLVRTFLAWSLSVEMERRWPWQPLDREPVALENTGQRNRTNEKADNSDLPTNV